MQISQWFFVLIFACKIAKVNSEGTKECEERMYVWHYNPKIFSMLLLKSAQTKKYIYIVC